MDRRTFLKQSTFGAAAAPFLPFSGGAVYDRAMQVRTAHLILLVMGGARKQDYCSAELAPNIHRVAGEGFVFEEDHCEQVASHEAAFANLLHGRESTRAGADYPSILDYAGNSLLVDSARSIPRLLQQYRPRLIVCRDRTFDAGHLSYDRYLQAVESTDDSVGRVFDWVKAHAQFSANTAIVIRPEFGRDDEVNEHGQLHHSYGFYSTHRVASIFWGPDFNRGVDRTTVINALDLAPTLASLFGVDALHAQGRVLPGLLKTWQ
jgi:arylsulfatase A-like enzyme